MVEIDIEYIKTRKLWLDIKLIIKIVGVLFGIKMNHRNSKEVEMEKTIRVAHVMGKMMSGGVESIIMNYYRHIDKDKVQFDFIVDEDSTVIPIDEIEKLGGKVIMVPPYQKLHKYMIKLAKVFKENEYQIVHSNINALSVFPMMAAKIAGVKIRIAHNHSTSNNKEIKITLVKNVLKPFSKIFPNKYFACSELAGKWLFGEDFYNEGRVKLIKNAIDISKFIYNEDKRTCIRKEMELEDKFVIGHVGRFMFQKNHDFLIEIFNEVNKIDNNVYLLLIGEGELENSIYEKVEKLGLTSKVKFLGIRDDVNDIMQAMDVFVFPSRYEGLGMVAVEAQAAGLKTIVSDEIPIEAKVTELLEYCNLEQTPKEWAIKILESKNGYLRQDTSKEIEDNGYEIKRASKKLEEIYLEEFNRYE